MAEAIALYLVKKIGDVLVTEGITQAKALIKTVSEVHGQMRDIKCRLELMQAYLQYADERRNEDKASAAWVNQVRELVFEIEYLVDSYNYTMAITGLFRKGKNAKPLKDISDALKGCYTRLDTLTKDKLAFDIKVERQVDNKALLESKKQAEFAYTIPDEDVIGFRKQKNLLKNWLKGNKISERKVISVWGMGGAGKTTLVANVFKSQFIVGQFDRRAWVFVSQDYDRDVLIRNIITDLYRKSNMKVPEGLESNDYVDLVEILNAFLVGKRYLIILDDVWATTVWKDLSNIIYENNMNGRIVITTRDQEVASVADGKYNLELKPLDENFAWDLFCHHVFYKKGIKECPKNLIELAGTIVQRCGGLPLAIVWIANHLAQKLQSEYAWKSAYNILTSTKDKNVLNAILNLSISNLPSYLRNCFLYCSVFPEDYEIKRKRLLRLWISEGLIVKENEEITEMEVAQDYLDQLVGRSMFQVVRKNEYGRVKALRIHYFVREMILKKQQYESLYQLWNRKIEDGQYNENIRCLSIVELEDSRAFCTPKLQTLHLFSYSISRMPLSKYKLLRVLNLECSGIKSLPQEMSTLFNLRYLSIGETQVQQLFKSICILQNLETLDIRCKIGPKDMGDKISKLHKLKHLIGYEINGYDMKGIQNLKHLQTLKHIIATKQLLKDLRALKELRTLHIDISTGEESIKLATCVRTMEHLINLRINITEKLIYGETIQLNAGGLTELPPRLEKLYLRGSLYNGMLPICLKHSLAINLKSLTLHFSELEEDPLPSLAAISPNLLFIRLDCCLKSATVNKLCFPVGSFPNLKTLEVIGLVYLNTVEIQEKSLVHLEKVVFYRCYGMRGLPRSIGDLPKLNELYLRNMPDELIKKVREDRPTTFKRIPFIKHRFHLNGKNYEEKL